MPHSRGSATYPRQPNPTGSPAVGARSVVPGVVLGGHLVLVLPPAAAEGGGEEPGRDGARGERGAGEPEPPRAEPRRHPEEAEAAAEAEEEQPRPARAPGPAHDEADHDGRPDRHRAEQHVHGHLRHRGPPQQRHRLLAPPRHCRRHARARA